MKTKHLSEEELQQYVLNNMGGDPEFTEHLQSCDDCKLAIENYRLLFSNITQQEVPVFEFDLSKLVLQQLEPSPKKEILLENFLMYSFSIAMFIIIGVLLYFFRVSLFDLFRGVGKLEIYITVASVMVLLILLCIDQYKTYQHKMKMLDLY